MPQKLAINLKSKNDANHEIYIKYSHVKATLLVE